MTQKRFKKLLMSRGFTKRAVDGTVTYLKLTTIMYHEDVSKEVRKRNMSYEDLFYNVEIEGLGKFCDFYGKADLISYRKIEELQDKVNGQRNIS